MRKLIIEVAKFAIKISYVDLRSFKVIDFVTNRKCMYDILVVNSDLGRILHGCIGQKLLPSHLTNVLVRGDPCQYVDKLDVTKTINPIKGRDVNWLHLAIQVQPRFLIFDIRALWRSGLSARVPECQKLKM